MSSDKKQKSNETVANKEKKTIIEKPHNVLEKINIAIVRILSR